MRRSTKRVDLFYKSTAWKELRAQAVKRDRHRCVLCGAAAYRNAHVDHIQPRRSRPDLALALENLRTLCASCHSRQTATFSGGFGNAGRAPGEGCDADGNPTSPREHW